MGCPKNCTIFKICQNSKGSAYGELYGAVFGRFLRLTAHSRAEIVGVILLSTELVLTWHDRESRYFTNFDDFTTLGENGFSQNFIFKCLMLGKVQISNNN